MRNRQLSWWHWVLIIGGLLIAFRLFFFARILILIGLAALVVGIFGYILYQQLSNRPGGTKNQQKSQRAIQERMRYCEDQLDRLQDEISDIMETIKDLQNSKKTGELTPSNREETERLLKGFQQELRMRQKKRTFFETCLRKLNKLYHNQELSIKLSEKEERLRQLQEDHYEDLAEMEALRSDMEMDVFYLDTIESLSERMLLTSSTDEAEALQLELEKMTRSLDEL